MKLSEGDMRRCVNMLQSIYMTLVDVNTETPNQVDPDYVYSITGSISPNDIENILKILLEDGVTSGV